MAEDILKDYKVLALVEITISYATDPEQAERWVRGTTTNWEDWNVVEVKSIEEIPKKE